MRCQQCHTDNPNDARFCTSCGAGLYPSEAVTQVALCQNCGLESKEGGRFCISCGSNFPGENIEPIPDGLGSALGQVREGVRDKTRDELASTLNSIGVKAKMAERGRVEEKAENSWYQRSLGTIDIPEGPIRMINILKKDRSKDSGPRWWVVLGIPDDRLASRRQTVKIKTVRKKKFPLFGEVIDVIWKGHDGGNGLVHTLSGDVPTKTLSKRIGNLEIKSQTQGWTLTVDRRFSPTAQQWETVEKIAFFLLSSTHSS